MTTTRILLIFAGMILLLALPSLVNHWMSKRSRRRRTMTHDEQVERHLESLYLEKKAREK